MWVTLARDALCTPVCLIEYTVADYARLVVTVIIHPFAPRNCVQIDEIITLHVCFNYF